MGSPLADKKIVLGVTGSIAAYKAADLVRRLQERGAEVQVVMTEAAKQFITTDTLRTLSGMPVVSDMFAEPAQWRVGHVSQASWAQLVLIAPATANTMASLAHGLANDVLSCLVLSTRAPVAIAPAMDEGMWFHPATQANTARLVELGYTIIEPESGPLASGKSGKGRLASIEKIVAEAERLVSPQDLAGLHAVVTAGPTREMMDAVRFISNRSSGKMGFCIAESARRRGARVTLISGPTALSAPLGMEVHRAESAAQMYKIVMEKAKGADLFIGAAAVGDLAPEKASPEKMKRSGPHSLRLVPTQDIIAKVASLGKGRPKFVVGFAAESANLMKNAREKLTRKRLDMIVANDITQAEGGFGSDFNQASLILADGTQRALPRMSKLELAEEILNEVKAQLVKA
ncbi:MAG: bifunctional phosphopantothenoylcysteine decarboxylase/phosphopantothenate--cysteine ligase CoaBC [Armatimonadetes bacterium]|nr:bifunctional phosphopantothenoylcysteine decarboxylase/phosphopantothenate--cysteine ligase CoaBC [Armatimonadota bacterium]NIM24465.1 bifunctional phosphopantothenoylcysteine decarboxylase/phosphopantothenate--cysteine ligase CoaBC [Armatimonadota bacterium]NIM68336.1 bifunctional phosphopantothenoylcysteine decarboxylase/phosphopantothenate--cysteine ligase CoaBC [Armatimonadota bacterium]NIM76740.1 bifunctional phosphopantothenoylcysteine decarboxylase/phosphopantothenate--cysteine ligase 